MDQPSIAVGNGSVWVDWNSSGNMVARGAPVTGLGTWGPFDAQQAIPSATGSFGGIAVGPGPNGGKVMVTYQNPTGGQGPATIYVNVDADGLGAGGFGARITVTTTNVGGFDFIPAQSGRSIDAEAGLVWDATGGPFNNRVYLVYTEETVNENNDTEIYLRTSTNDGTTWSAPVRVNDDPLGPIRSQFLPYIALDRSQRHGGDRLAGCAQRQRRAGQRRDEHHAQRRRGVLRLVQHERRRDLGGQHAPERRASPTPPTPLRRWTMATTWARTPTAASSYAVWADNANCDGTNAERHAARLRPVHGHADPAGAGHADADGDGHPADGDPHRARRPTRRRGPAPASATATPTPAWSPTIRPPPARRRSCRARPTSAAPATTATP